MNQSGQKLWGLLLVVDSFFVVIFGGALAAKIYGRWQEPSNFSSMASPPIKVHLTKKIVEPPPLKSTATSVAVKQTPAPALSHSKEKKNTESLRHKTDPQIMAPRGKGKATGVIFRYQNHKAKEVLLAGAFLLHTGKKSLVKTKHGTWKLTVYLTPGNYHYYFLVDGKKVLDPQNPKSKRHASIFSVGR